MVGVMTALLLACGIPNPASIPVGTSSSLLNNALIIFFALFTLCVVSSVVPIHSNNDFFDRIESSKRINSSEIS